MIIFLLRYLKRPKLLIDVVESTLREKKRHLSETFFFSGIPYQEALESSRNEFRIVRRVSEGIHTLERQPSCRLQLVQWLLNLQIRLSMSI